MSVTEHALDRWRSILDRLRSAGWAFYGYDEDVGAGDVLLGHDVDLSPDRADGVARIGRKLGVSATYFVLLGTPTDPKLAARFRDERAALSTVGADPASSDRQFPARPRTVPGQSVLCQI